MKTETATRQLTTLRKCIEMGGRGDFARALLRLYEKPCPVTYEHACMYADEANRAALARAFDWHKPYSFLAFRHRLRKEFPGLGRLDEPTDNPHAIPLRGEPR